MMLKKYKDFLLESNDYDGYINKDVAINLVPGEKLYITGFYYDTAPGGFAAFEKGKNWYTDPVVFLMLDKSKSMMLILDMSCKEDMNVDEILENPMDITDPKTEIYKKYHYCANWYDLDNIEFDPDHGFQFGSGSKAKYFKFRDSSKNKKSDLLKSLSNIHKYKL